MVVKINTCSLLCSPTASVFVFPSAQLKRTNYGSIFVVFGVCFSMSENDEHLMSVRKVMSLINSFTCYVMQFLWTGFLNACCWKWNDPYK